MTQKTRRETIFDCRPPSFRSSSFFYRCGGSSIESPPEKSRLSSSGYDCCHAIKSSIIFSGFGVFRTTLLNLQATSYALGLSSFMILLSNLYSTARVLSFNRIAKCLSIMFRGFAPPRKGRGFCFCFN